MLETLRTVRLLDPTAQPPEGARPLAPRPDDLRGKRIGILHNTKANADVLMHRIAELLCHQYGASGVVYRRKAHAATAAPDTLLEELMATCDVVLVGSGD